MEKKGRQSITATQEWRDRMTAARKQLPDGVGQQDVLNWIVDKSPELDRLTYATRWRNAWHSRVADPEFTKLVEQATIHFRAKAKTTTDRLKRLKLKKVQ